MKFLFSIALCLGLGSTALAQSPPDRPHPDLEPVQVVEAMLFALKKNTDAGITELYRFSSPKNREVTGTLEQFAAMIREGFPDMLGHKAARAAPPLIDGERAMVPVELIGSDDALHRYIFLFSRQSIPECRGCWMADAVFSPDDLGPGEGPPELPADGSAGLGA